MRAALYARYSLEKQNEASIQDQFRQARRTASANNLDVVAEFSDEGISGGTASRPGYQSLLAAARRGEFEVIIAEDISRLWRNRSEYGQRSAELEDLGLNILTCVGDDTRRDGYGLVLGIKQAIAEHQRREISYRTRRSLEGLALAGKSTGGRTYGYQGDEARVVREIFQRAATGDGPGPIARWLNNHQIPAPRGGLWGRSTVTALLANARYAGTVVWGATEARGGARDSRLKRRVARPEPIVSRFDEGSAIIPVDLYKSVQTRACKPYWDMRSLAPVETT